MDGRDRETILNQVAEKAFDGLRPPRSEWPRAIYHYTSAGALSGILQSRSLWATHAGFLNDPTDSRYHMEFVTEFIQRLVRVKDADAFRDYVRKRADHLLARLHVMSFCEHQDDLSLWRAYGDNTRGFALAISPALLNPPATITGTDVDASIEFGLSYRPILYLDRTACLERIASSYDEICRLIGAPSRETWEEIVETIFCCGRYESLSIKNPKFSHEQEHRIVVVDARQNAERGSEIRSNLGCRLRSSGDAVLTYVTVPLPDEAIVSITVGPGRHFESSTAQLTQMLKFYGFDPEKIPIIESEIPWA